MRVVLRCLVPCCLLAAAPSGPAYSVSPPERRVPDNGAPLSDAARMEALARTDAVAFLEECLRRYQRDVTGYTATLQKQERLGGELGGREVIRVAFRESPYGVALEWLEGGHRAFRVLYVAGENDNQLLAAVKNPVSLPLAPKVLVVSREVHSAEARESGRFTLDHFGMAAGMRRAYDDWKKAAQRGELHVEYRGRQAPAEAGGRTCYVLHRSGFARPEHDGVTEQTLYIDTETWLQVGSVAHGAAGLIGEYYFRDVRLNPEFPPGQFRREALKK
jgi:hypothetical protein